MKRLGLALLALAILHLAVLASGLLPPSSEEGRQALALLEMPNQRASGQRDGFPLLWTWRRDIPLDRIEAVTAEDRQRWTDAIASDGQPEPDPSRGISAYPRLAYDRTALCPRAPESCLVRVRADVDKARAALQTQQALLDRLTSLDRADHVGSGMPPTLQSPLPDLGGIMELTSTRNALLFVDGEHAAALDRSCADLATWRRLRNHTDSLVVDMVGIAIAQQQLQLLAEMLAELPADIDLPPSCADALAPPQEEELDQCDDWRGEFRLNRHVIEREVFTSAAKRSWLVESGTRALFNTRATLERAALGMAALCRGELDYVTPAPSLLERIYNPAGIVLTEVAPPANLRYAQRARDFLALVQGVRIAVWLRGQGDVKAAFATRPDPLRRFDERIELDADAATINVRMLAADANRPADWTLPLAHD